MIRPWRNLGVCLLGFLLVIVLTESVTRSYGEDCMEAIGIEHGREAREIRQFNSRDRSLPAVILIGGSDTREAYEMNQARPYFQQRGWQIFNFGLSAHNPPIEKYQVLSALEIGPQDVIFYNVGLDEFISVEEPNRAATVWESPKAYLKRVNLEGGIPSPSHYLEVWLDHELHWVRDRDPLRRCVFRKASAQPGFRWHIYGDKPEDPATFNSKLEEFRTKKFDSGHSVQPDALGLRLMRELQAQWGRQLIFCEVPRNPLIGEVYSPEFIGQFYELLKPFHLRRWKDSVHLEREDFFDFNHLNSEGAKRFTAQVLPWMQQAVEGNAR